MNVKNLVPTLPVHPTKKPDKRKLSSIQKIVVHTTDWEVDPVRLAQYDIGPNHISNTGCPTATYHYYINQAGEVSKLVNEDIVTWHAAGHNTNSVAICLAYKTDPQFESGKKKRPDPTKIPTAEMRAALQGLLVELCIRLAVSPTQIFGHRELFGTGFIFLKGHKALRKTCPGMTIDLGLLRINVIVELQQKIGVKSDGVWGPKSEVAFRDALKKRG